MSDVGLTLTGVVVTGPGKPAASVEFRSGLNLIVGASETGKTYIFQILDLLFGASTPPKSISESQGYDEATLGILSRDGDAFSLRRALQGGEAKRLPGAWPEIQTEAQEQTLGSVHSRGKRDTISAVLLEYLGLFGREVREDQYGKKHSLSFRDVARLILVDEKRIISEQSPALTDQHLSHTKERSVFSLFLTGTDDTAVVSQERPKERNARLRAQDDVYLRLLNEREQQWNALGLDAQGLDAQCARVRAAVEHSSSVVVTVQTQIDELTRKRDGTWSELQDAASRRLFLGEQIKRLELLSEHYASDKARMEAAIEAGQAFEVLPTGQCPVCGHRPVSADTAGVIDDRLHDFQKGCQGEISRIDALAVDLAHALTDVRKEEAEVNSRRSALQKTLDECNDDIEVLLEKRGSASGPTLTELIEQQQRLASATALRDELAQLRSAHDRLQTELNTKSPRPTVPQGVSTASAATFCEFVAATLSAWKYPYGGKVAFDPKAYDIAVGHKARGSLGKGHRALTYAAFVISLMRYCRARGLPHPGFVILDTPLNPFRGQDTDSPDRLNPEVQEAFYADLAADRSGDQFIVLENTEPPTQLRSRMNYVHFSGRPGLGRQGFFPARTEEASGRTL